MALGPSLVPSKVPDEAVIAARRSGVCLAVFGPFSIFGVAVGSAVLRSAAALLFLCLVLLSLPLSVMAMASFLVLKRRVYSCLFC